MELSGFVFTERAIAHGLAGGCAKKAELFACVLKSSGSLSAALYAFLDTIKEVLEKDEKENLSIYSDIMEYSWSQLSSLAIAEGLSEYEAVRMHERYLTQLRSAESIEDMDSICTELVYEYAGKLRALNKEIRYSPQVRDCVSYIRSNLREKLSVSAIADVMHFSESYIAHKFKDEVGTSINQFVIAERIREAECLLVGTQTISEIAGDLGFASQSHFTETFKKHTGMTPLQFKKQLK